MQSVSSRIWTRVAVSISYDDNYYTTGTSINPGSLWTHMTLMYILKYSCDNVDKSVSPSGEPTIAFFYWKASAASFFEDTICL